MPQMPVNAFIAVGSNIEPHGNIPAALRLIAAQKAVRGVSTFYRTAPLGRPGQPDYCNGAFRIEADQEPEELHFGLLRGVEAALGRARTEDPYGPRTIDLDLVLYNGIVLKSESLSLPDPEIYERNFIAIPLAELAPTVRVPGDGRTLSEVAQTLSAEGLERDARLTGILKELLADEQRSR